MTPKFLILHRFELGKLHDEYKVVYVNPRRVDCFYPEAPPNNPRQKTMYCGTRVCFGGKQFVIVHETVDEIEKMLKR